jgi:hypothetical protein
MVRHRRRLGLQENYSRELHGARHCERVARKHLQREPPSARLDLCHRELARSLAGIRCPLGDGLEQRTSRCHDVVMPSGVFARSAWIS